MCSSDLTARLLALHYGSVDALLTALNPDADLAAAHAALVEIDQIGDAMADDIAGFFSSPAHFDMITALTAALTILPPERPADDSPLSGKILVFTGKLEQTSRAEAKARAESLGAKVSGSVSAKTDYLVVGADAGSKARKAAELGVAILTEADWLTLTDNGDGTFTFTPDTDWFGDVTFSFEVSDGFTTVDNTAGLVVTDVDDTNLPPEVTPVVLAGDGGIDEDTDITFSEDVIREGASDPDDPLESLEIVDLQISNGEGTLTDNGNGTWTFEPDPDWHGDVEFSFGVSDGENTTPNTASLVVNPVQDEIGRAHV